jgi:DNA replication and repair protein RecF
MTAASLRRLTLTNFRSYHAASLDIGANLVVLTGPNGAGKTNLIEAISFLMPGRGLRRATLEEVAFSEGNGSWAVSAEVEGMLGLATLGTGIEPPAAEANTRTRLCRIDREPVGSAAAFADHLRVIWLVPAMDQLFMGPASERRRFLDRLVLAVDAEHQGRVNALERALRSRNRLLEDPRPDPHWLDAIEHETAELAVAVAAQRAETVHRLQAALAQAQRRCLPVRRDRAGRLDGAAAAGSSRGRDRGTLPRHPQEQPCPRRRRRPHARRPASHRSRGHLFTEEHPRCGRFDRRAEGAADRPRARACGPAGPR